MVKMLRKNLVTLLGKYGHTVWSNMVTLQYQIWSHCLAKYGHTSRINLVTLFGQIRSHF